MNSNISQVVINLYLRILDNSNIGETALAKAHANKKHI